MAESNKTTVIDVTDNPKNAALFFDYVIPIKIFNDSGKLALKFPKEMKYMFPLQMQGSSFGDAYNELSTCLIARGIASLPYALPDDIITMKREVIEAGKKFYFDLECYFNDYNINYCGALYESNVDSNCNESYNCTSLKLAQLPLIDTTKSEWEQIIQIREDENSISKLRNLRLFFNDNYSGKEKKFIEDDLNKRLEDYENVTKDWGFETVTSSIQMLLTSPVTLTSVGSSLALALTGEPLSALATAGTGSIIEVGKMSLHIAKEKKKLSVLQRDHPLAYIIDAKKKLE